jgi:hypothetical protein
VGAVLLLGSFVVAAILNVTVVGPRLRAMRAEIAAPMRDRARVPPAVVDAFVEAGRFPDRDGPATVREDFRGIDMALAAGIGRVYWEALDSATGRSLVVAHGTAIVVMILGLVYRRPRVIWTCGGCGAEHDFAARA